MLDKRLLSICEEIPSGSIVADIGTDHAYLPCELIRKNQAAKCYACDIAIGPLESAIETIKKAGFEQQITTILCPGLNDVPNDANVVVIAGMGYMSAKTILENDIHRLKQFDLIIIQVNREVEKIRKWIIEHQYKITFEKLVYNRHYYVIIGFSPKLILDNNYNEFEILFGKFLNTGIECNGYYQKLIDRNTQIINNITSDETIKRLKEQNNYLLKKTSS